RRSQASAPERCTRQNATNYIGRFYEFVCQSYAIYDSRVGVFISPIRAFGVLFQRQIPNHPTLRNNVYAKHTYSKGIRNFECRPLANLSEKWKGSIWGQMA